MKKRLLLLVLSLPTLLFAQDEYIQFKGKSPIYKATGFVNKYEFTSFKWDKSNPTSIKAKIEIDLNSISEKSEKLTKHLKAEDFFNIEIFPMATVNIADVQVESDSTFKTVSLLTIKGIEKEALISFSINDEKTFITGSCSFNRTEYTISKNKKIDELIHISFLIKIPSDIIETETK